MAALRLVRRLEDGAHHLDQLSRNKGLPDAIPAIIQHQQVAALLPTHKHDVDVRAGFLEGYAEIKT